MTDLPAGKGHIQRGPAGCATRAGETIVFEAETESAQYGKLLWKGVVRGPRLDGTMTMVRDGQAAGEKWVLAGEKR